MKIVKDIKKGFESYEFPLSVSEIEIILQKLPAEDLEGLKEIVISHPIKNEDHKRFGRYIPHGKVYLFAHLKKDGVFHIPTGSPILGEEEKSYTLEGFRKKALEAVLHEIDHHVRIQKFGDFSEDPEKNYSKRYAHIFAAKDKEVLL